MNGSDHVRGTMRRGFRAYFAACMPNASRESVLETAVVEHFIEAQRRRARYQRPRPTPSVAAEKKVKGFVSHLCEGDGLEDCAICFDSITVGQSVLTLQCSDTNMHCFHESCISPWLEDKGTCPVCRADIL